MAFPTSVNDQITDAVTQVNTKVEGGTPGNQREATASGAHNATEGRQEGLMEQAATIEGINTLYAADTAAAGIATEKNPGSSSTETKEMEE